MSEHDELLEDLDSEAPQDIKGGNSISASYKDGTVSASALGQDASTSARVNTTSNGASADVAGANAAAGWDTDGNLTAEVKP